MDSVVRRVAAGEMVAFRPVGSSMVPLIKSRQLVTVVPVLPELVEPGDIVLARVVGSLYLHLVSVVDRERRRVQISNNRGRAKGWTSAAAVSSKCHRSFTDANSPDSIQAAGPAAPSASVHRRSALAGVADALDPSRCVRSRVRSRRRSQRRAVCRLDCPCGR